MGSGGGRIAIVGGGLSGTALAIQLLRRPGGRVALIERSGAFGPGLAYGTRCERHLLNVRSRRMSLFPDAPDHFTRWLAAAGLDANPEGFARRADYGRYLQACLEEAQARAPGRLSLITGEAMAFTAEADRGVVRLGDGRAIAADHVVLAGGNPPPGALDLAGVEGLNGRSISDPWALDALEAVGVDDHVFLVGTGLTAVDVLLALEARGWRGRATAVSRRGLLPRVHGRPGEASAGSVPTGPLSGRVQQMRRQAREVSWTALMDGLRPHGQAMWLGASPAERRRFLRHLRPWWDVHRHRMAPEIGAAVERLAAQGRLHAAAGRLLEVEADGRGLVVTWRPRGAAEPRRSSAGWLVNCTGPQGDPSRAGEPLLEALFAAGAVRRDSLRLGLDVNPEGRVLDGEGRAQPRLWAMGPLTRGAFWEIVAVPDIRDQADALAARLSPPQSAEAPRRRTRGVAHLEEVDQSYTEHMAFALKFGARMMAAGAACMIHAVAPWFFTHTASREVARLHAQIAWRKQRPD